MKVPEAFSTRISAPLNGFVESIDHCKSEPTPKVVAAPAVNAVPPIEKVTPKSANVPPVPRLCGLVKSAFLMEVSPAPHEPTPVLNASMSSARNATAASTIFNGCMVMRK